MFHCVLYQPEIPPNTGNIIRLCANTGCQLHLIHPLGFQLDEKKLRRAGLDYHEWVNVREHDSFENFVRDTDFNRLFACSTKGSQNYSQVSYQANDAFIFGPETRGLPETLLADLDPQQVLRLPMMAGNRSLNLSNTVAIMIYEAWRQLGFQGIAN